MQDIISTLKNALQQAEAGLEVAVGRLAKDGTERGDFKPSEVLALACVREALAMPVSCLHQIQEPAAAEQAAWHAGLDEGRAQAAPAAVAVPDKREASVSLKLAELDSFLLKDARQALWAIAQTYDDDELRIRAQERLERIDEQRCAGRESILNKAALAATPAAVPVVLPEPDFHVRPASAVQPHRALMIWDNDATSEPAYFARTVRALLATATGLPAQVVGQLPVLYVSKEQLDHHRDPDGPDSANAGRYLPARKTPAGKLTTPLFVAPQAQADARDALIPAKPVHPKGMTSINARLSFNMGWMACERHHGIRSEDVEQDVATDAAIAAAKGE